MSTSPPFPVWQTHKLFKEKVTFGGSDAGQLHFEVEWMPEAPMGLLDA